MMAWLTQLLLHTIDPALTYIGAHLEVRRHIQNSMADPAARTASLFRDS